MAPTRRNLMMASLAACALIVPRTANAQGAEVTAEALDDAIREDQAFEQLVFNVNTLRSLLVVIADQQTKELTPYAQAGEPVDFEEVVNGVRNSRDKILSDLKIDPSPIVFSQQIYEALENTAGALSEGGIRPDSPIESALMNSLKIFMALTSKSGRTIESWYCGIFPFNRFC